MDESLLWFKPKASILKKSLTLKYSISVLTIPIEYVCTSSTKIHTTKTKCLSLTRSRLLFECCLSPDPKARPEKFEINLHNILLFSYSNERGLFNVTLKEDYYKTLMLDVPQDDQLFLNTIWFCLDVPTSKEYSQILEALSNNDKVKSQILSKDDFDSFLTVMSRNLINAKFIYKWKISSNNEMVAKVSPEKESNGDERIVKKQTKRRKEDFPCDILSKQSKKSQQKYVYCPSPTSSFEITLSDLLCLRPKTYLNDNIINLYIMYIYHEIMTNEQRNKTHIFNCFFNTKLIGTKHQMATDTPHSRHQRVAKWTKNVDIFNKDFLLIPVIENQHWFLVIVCFPWMAGMIDYSKLFPSSIKSQIPTNETPFATQMRVDKLNEIQDKDKINPMPCILIFDSLSFQRRTDKVNIIREYLKSEWDAKRLDKDGPLIFDKTTARGYSPKVPQQNNHTDCGVYLLHYVETFFKCPIKNFTVDFFQKFLTRWFDQDQVDRKRKEIRESIIKVVQKSSEDLDSINNK